MISKERQQEFWERCGLTYTKDRDKTLTWYDSEENFVDFGYPDIDLNNLFKYAVPKARDYSENNALQVVEFLWQGVNISNQVECNVVFDNEEFCGRDEDPATALFRALDEAL